jgi:hypothetical protein
MRSEVRMQKIETATFRVSSSGNLERMAKALLKESRGRFKLKNFQKDLYSLIYDEKNQLFGKGLLLLQHSLTCVEDINVRSHIGPMLIINMQQNSKFAITHLFVNNEIAVLEYSYNCQYTVNA